MHETSRKAESAIPPYRPGQPRDRKGDNVKHAKHFLYSQPHRSLGRRLALVLAFVLCLNLASPIALAQSAPPDKPAGGGQGGAPGGGGGANTQSYDYSGTLSGTLTADGKETADENQTRTAGDADTNAALVKSGGTLTIKNDTLEKHGSDTNGDTCNFYGVNSVLLAVGENSKARVTGTKLTAGGTGSNGVFATDKGTVYINDSTIATAADNSRGLDATYGGTIVANRLGIDTQGNHCAAAATDRGGGNVSVTNSTLNTKGSGSPILYSTGTIEVDGVTGTAEGSQIAGMEGLNTIRIAHSNLTSKATKATASDPVANGVIIYQSTSGDAETSAGNTARFEVSDSTLSSAISEGSMFYVTNTKANVILKNTVLDFDADKAGLLTAAGNDSNNWGTAGQNGAILTFTAIGETLKGNINVDTISTANIFLTEGTTYTGATAITQANGTAADKPITVNIDSNSTWVVTDNSAVTDLNVAAGGKIVDSDGSTVTVKKGDQTLVQGNSKLTVTVSGNYSTTVSTSDANTLSASTIDRSDFDGAFGTSTAFGTNAATESITIISIPPLLARTSQISRACSPVSGCETYNSEIFTPSLSAYSGSRACSASIKAAWPPSFWASATICSAMAWPP